MPNHIHLLILSGIRRLVSLMHPLLTGYAIKFNLKYRRAGHLFQNRYKSIICQEDPYFLELIRYIALNPVRVGMIQTPDELATYPWTSHSSLLGRFPRAWQDIDAMLGRFGPTVREAQPAYERFVLDKWTQGHQDRLEGGGLIRSLGGLDAVLEAQRSGERQCGDVRILGEGTFVEEILGLAEKEERQNQDIRKNFSRDDLRQAVAAYAGVQADALLSTDRHRPIAEARAMVVYAAIDWLGLQGTAVAQWLNLSIAGVSKSRVRGRCLAQKNQLLEWLKSAKLNSVP
jgi:hypothetical protein